MPTPVSGAVGGVAAVPARVCNLGPRDVEESTMRQNLMSTVRKQQLSIFQPFDFWYWVP